MVTQDMWDVSRPEFSQIFDRTSEDVDLKNCTTPQQIDNALKIERHKSKMKAREAKVRVVREYHAYRTEQLDKLIEKDFSGRAIFEANRNPKGMIGQTLLHGRVEARKRVLAQKRAEIRSRGAKIMVRTPEFSESLRRLNR